MTTADRNHLEVVARWRRGDLARTIRDGAPWGKPEALPAAALDLARNCRARQLTPALAARELAESIVGPKLLDGLELITGRAARPHEVGMVGVGKTVRARARLCHDGALLEREDGLRRAHDREQRLDRLPALRIGDGMCRALGNTELDPFHPRYLTQERRRANGRRS